MNDSISFMPAKAFLSSLALIIVLFCFSGDAFGQDSATITASNANLRGTPNADGKIVTVLTENDSVQVLIARAPWYLVQAEDYVGWLHGNTIRLNDASSSSAADFDSFDTVRPVVISPPSFSAPKRRSPGRSAPSRSYIRGPRGGCYYINSNGNKTYVDRGLCN